MNRLDFHIDLDEDTCPSLTAIVEEGSFNICQNSNKFHIIAYLDQKYIHTEYGMIDSIYEALDLANQCYEEYLASQKA